MTLEQITERIVRACDRVGRDPAEVQLVAVSKGHPESRIRELAELGHRDFGENRADELAAKAAVLGDDIRWHFVGHLQSNKARLVRPVAAALHSLDRLSLAKAWLKGPGVPPPAYLQVNVGREPQKHGVAPEEAVAVAESFAMLGIELVGVMAIIPIVAHPEEARPFFRELAQIRDRIARQIPGATGLSMGMTDDFEVAVEEGATVIRVGRAIFEPYPSTAQ